MSWREVERDDKFVVYRCGFCRKLAVGTSQATPSACCCITFYPNERHPERGVHVCSCECGRRGSPRAHANHAATYDL